MIGCRWVEPLHHPGPVLPERRTSIATASLSRPVSLAPGKRLVDALDQQLRALGASSGQVELLDGTLGRVSYCYPALVEDGSAAVTFSAAYGAIAPARLIAGSATVGFRHGQRFIHCHAAWFDAHGDIRGGHLWPETMIGPGPVQAIVHAFNRVELNSETDPESCLPVFSPHPRPPHKLSSGDTTRAVMSRLAPGVELSGAVCEIMQEHGFQQATIAGSVGSLVGAVLQRNGSVLVVDGPATEVTLTGQFDLRAPESEPYVSAFAIDRFGVVHTGRLLARENIVAVTLELLVEETAR